MRKFGNATPVATTSPLATSNHSNSSCTMPYEDSRVVLVVVYSAVCTLGLPANCLTAWLALRQVRQGNVLAVYLFCLALCELLYVGTLPLWIVYILKQHRWMLSMQACRVTAYVFFCNIYVSILFLCCISCDRFLAVVYALESRGHRRQKTAIFISASIFVLVGLVHYPVFVMEDEETCFETSPMDSRTAGYYYTRFAVGFAIPLSVIIFTNHRILRSVQQSVGLSTAQKAKVKHSAVAVVVIFLVCFTPFHLVLLVKAAAFSYYRGDYTAMCAFEASLYTASMVFLCLSTVNGVADPIIYMLTTDHSRQEMSRIHRGWKQWSGQAEATKLTNSRDSEEPRSPTVLISHYGFPRPVHPPGLPQGPGGSLCTPERLVEENCAAGEATDSKLGFLGGKGVTSCAGDTVAWESPAHSQDQHAPWGKHRPPRDALSRARRILPGGLRGPPHACGVPEPAGQARSHASLSDAPTHGPGRGSALPLQRPPGRRRRPTGALSAEREEPWEPAQARSGPAQGDPGAGRAGRAQGDLGVGGAGRDRARGASRPPGWLLDERLQALGQSSALHTVEVLWHVRSSVLVGPSLELLTHQPVLNHQPFSTPPGGFQTSYLASRKACKGIPGLHRRCSLDRWGLGCVVVSASGSAVH
ncbi:probable G-protein coupled receptor 132 [Carlito syrichta]|uniref:Probable G-protein coupled receptor 132 n=1 Tax=Carlito syrichta TaxID=1868482 RepID=A0A3Q0DR35_CARSF|nr:probable G-protein coupled receptor 132 [Carlito syrichta]